MPAVEPIPDYPAAVATLGESAGDDESANGEGRRSGERRPQGSQERALVVADYHAGIEASLAKERGVEVDSRAEGRRGTVLELIEEVRPDRLVVLGDFMHSIGGPGGAERGEIEVLLESLSVPVTVVRGNHDGAIEEWIEGAEVTGTEGIRLGRVGFAHGHTWPSTEVLSAGAVCVGHEHPMVRLTDAVGGSRVERVWLRGGLDREAFADQYDELPPAVGRPGQQLVVFPAFNDLSGGTWVNAGDGEFLCPFLPDALVGAQAYLLDGTRLGPYDRV
ncbi:phosphoesterase [Halobacteriales archaeon QS_8_69_26]|nr:MAG: phosphoesterase [Halobacteriales archaeon QS_8_69_26]